MCLEMCLKCRFVPEPTAYQTHLEKFSTNNKLFVTPRILSTCTNVRVKAAGSYAEFNESAAAQEVSAEEEMADTDEMDAPDVMTALISAMRERVITVEKMIRYRVSDWAGGFLVGDAEEVEALTTHPRVRNIVGEKTTLRPRK